MHEAARDRTTLRTWGVLMGTGALVVLGCLVIAPHTPPGSTYWGGNLGVEHAPAQAAVFLVPPIVGALLALSPKQRRYGIAVICGWAIALLVILATIAWGVQTTLD
jgi:hypothetical protein